MFSDPAVIGMIVFTLVFLGTWTLGFIVFLRAYGDKRRVLARVKNLTAEKHAAVEAVAQEKITASTLPLIGSLFLPKEADRLAQLKALFAQAGMYHAHAPALFVGAKWLLMLIFPVIAVATLLFLGQIAMRSVPVVALSACALGMWAPHLWLRSKISKRQRVLRAAFPDALDMLVLCLEGGISLMAAVQRVTDELHVVHQELGAEMNILERSIQIGLSPGQALKELGQRCGLEEVRDLASTILQSEQYGASVAKTFRTYADTYRRERQLWAEEMAQKAAVKILFPTLLFIFPAIFIVVLGPAAFQMSKIFAR